MIHRKCIKENVSFLFRVNDEMNLLRNYFIPTVKYSCELFWKAFSQTYVKELILYLDGRGWIFVILLNLKGVKHLLCSLKTFRLFKFFILKVDFYRIKYAFCVFLTSNKTFYIYFYCSNLHTVS